MPNLASTARPVVHPLSDLPEVICLAGPTAAGKTALALEIAEEMDCEIVNADSRQLYADFPIITAQPSQSEFKRVPHHLYGILESNIKISAGQWAEKAARICSDIALRGKIPLFVGGTGFYFDALLNGLAEIPEVPAAISLEIATELITSGPEKLYNRLLQLDPLYAAKIHPNDKQRIQRALEISAATGRPFSWWHENRQRKPLAKGPLFVLSTRLAELEPLLAQRIDKMLEQGAYAEAETAWHKCTDENAPAWNGIGCAELLAFIEKKISMQECKRLWLANTRAYAKRQITWFRGRKNAIWINTSNLQDIANFIRKNKHET